MNVVLLTFANSQTDHLASLGEEDDGVHSALINRSLKGDYFLYRDSYITAEKLNEVLSKHRDELSLFLYSGHAGQKGLYFDQDFANEKGLASLLGQSAKSGVLKLVVLNGCATGGQVKRLLDQGVPAVIATSAPVKDRAAKAFSLKFFQGIGEKRLTIREAYEEGVRAAQLVTDQDLPDPAARSPLFGDNEDQEAGLWGLFGEDDALDIHPLPMARTRHQNSQFEPNVPLTDTLFQSLLEAGCRDIRNLSEQEEEGEYVERGDKQTAIVNVLPYPIAIHLQKLLCPTELAGEGYDQLDLRRLEQIGLLYQVTTEFLAFVMLSQLWELKLDQTITQLPDAVSTDLQAYFGLDAAAKATYDYLPLIIRLREYFDTLREGQGVTYFVDELKELQALVEERSDFSIACGSLANFWLQAHSRRISESDAGELCEEAERRLCDFFAPLGFMHRYTLTSIQNIDILKYRHQLTANYDHTVVKLMRAVGRPEQNYYVLPRLLDNRGVVLLKGKIKVIDGPKRKFTSENLEYLNLSPFVIDRNAFEKNADLANLVFFESARGDDFIFKNVKKPFSARDKVEMQAEGPFAIVYEQLKAFHTIILNEDPQLT